MSKQISFLFFILLVLSISFPQVDGLGIGPPSFELDLRIGGTNITKVYITSDGLDGQLIVGKENLPFSIEPTRINITKDDVNVPVELTFYGNETLEPGIYEGKVTFLAMTGGFVAYGIKIRVKINLLDESQEEGPVNISGWISDINDTESEPEIIIQEDESQDDTLPWYLGVTGVIISFIAGGIIVVISIVLIKKWWK